MDDDDVCERKPYCVWTERASVAGRQVEGSVGGSEAGEDFESEKRGEGGSGSRTGSAEAERSCTYEHEREKVPLMGEGGFQKGVVRLRRSFSGGGQCTLSSTSRSIFVVVVVYIAP